MSRSIRKGPYVDKNLYAKILKLNETSEKRVVKTWARACTVFPEMIGHTVAVHDGRKHVPIYVNEDMVGHKLGEFAMTRLYRGHAGGKNEKKSKRK